MRSLGVVLFAMLVWGPLAAFAQPAVQDSRSNTQLAQWLKEYPAADTDQDGVLTLTEAKAYRRQLVTQQVGTATPPNYGYRTEFTFATMSDDVKIALAIGFPPDYDPSTTALKWPAMFEMMGYPDSTAPRPPRDFDNRYVTVRASVRGAGASGGTIHALSPRSGMDGHEIIEKWIVKQPWSNGKVALHGHSWGGLTAFMIAATNPPHLTAVAVSGLFDDLYRDIGRIGGIRNSGFPVNWMVNLYKPTGPFDSGDAAIRARGMSAEDYDKIVASRPPWDLREGILWKSLNGYEDQPEFAQASPGTFAAGVRAPIHIMHAYQDEQTGPSGVWLWSAIPDDVPKRLVLSNGDHGDVKQFNRERMQWLDFWVLGDGKNDPADFTDRERRVQVYFETPAKSQQTNKPLVASDFPLPNTQWTRCYLREKEQLLTDPPEAERGGDVFQVVEGCGDKVQSLHYLFDFAKPAAICGPISVTLWVKCTTIDTDLFVMLADVDAEGNTQMLQRGLLRASHRAIDREKSKWVSVDGQQTLVRPRHTHRDNQPLVPGEASRLDIEVFPVGHVFRAGHKLALWVSQPPLGDPVTRHGDGQPAYRYESAMPPATVTLLRSEQYPSSVLLPLLPQLPPIGDRPLSPGRQAGIYVR